MKRILSFLISVLVLFSCAACKLEKTPATASNGLQAFSSALTTAGYQTVISTSPDGTTMVELIPPTTIVPTGTTVSVTQPTAPLPTTAPETVTTAGLSTAASTTTKTTGLSVVMPDIVIPDIVVPQPTVPTTVKPPQTTPAITRPAETTAAPTVPTTTTTAPVATTTQPTVPTTVTTTVATTTVPVTTVPATTVPVTTTSETTVPATTVPVTTIPATTVPVTSTRVPETTHLDTDNQTQTKVHYTSRYLYSTLNDVQKQWYQKIDVAVRNLEDEVILGPGIYDGENYYIYYLYMMDNPEYFYMTNRIGVFTREEGDGLILGYSDGTLTSGVELGGITHQLRDSIREKQAALNAKVNEIVASISPDLPDVEKELLIYDRIILGSSYNQQAQWDGYAEDNWTAYGVLINRKGVCESYAEAFQLLCYTVGINCTGVIGGGHKWNAVCLDGQWYMCDPTWDDPVGGVPFIPYHNYFNLTTEQILRDHKIDESHWKVPVCTATQYSYQNYFGK